MATDSTATAAIATEPVSTDKIKEDAPAHSKSANKVESLGVDSEAKKLFGLGQKHLVMGIFQQLSMHSKKQLVF
uniref:Uncharacterized protein n=1 Tax=Rhinolophus ferrumequinum TaxID=59479 RepID=A0A671E9C8_RHIFE